MNSFRPMQQMMGAAEAGQQQASSILPNPYQTRGKAKPVNPFQGSIDLLCHEILKVASGVGDQGDKYRECKTKLLKIAYDLSQVNNQLTKEAEGEEDSAGY